MNNIGLNLIYDQVDKYINSIIDKEGLDNFLKNKDEYFYEFNFDIKSNFFKYIPTKKDMLTVIEAILDYYQENDLQEIDYILSIETTNHQALKAYNYLKNTRLTFDEFLFNEEVNNATKLIQALISEYFYVEYCTHS